jgi:AbiU2
MRDVKFLAHMSEAHKILDALMEEGSAATAHFYTWWALRNVALPEFYDTMNNFSHVDFFHASNSGHYKLFFLALSKIFDRDSRVSGISHLKDALRDEGYPKLADDLQAKLIPMESVVACVTRIRNKTIIHNERSLPREKVYEINGITPDEVRELIDSICEAINSVAEGLGLSNRISKGDRHERATIAMLTTLRKGET